LDVLHEEVGKGLRDHPEIVAYHPRATMRVGLRGRGQYNIRDTFISIALSAGEDPGWVARVCGTPEEMIFRHYRTWIPGLNPNAGRKVGRILGGGGGGNLPLAPSPGVSPTPKVTAAMQRVRLLSIVEAGGNQPP